MSENRSISTPIEYMLASTFSGRVVFTSESLISYAGFDMTGRNLNEIFSDDIAAQIIYKCQSTGSYTSSASVLGSVFTVEAKLESDEIIIFIKSAPAEKSFSPVVSPVNKVSKELDSSLSVISMMLSGISAQQEGNTEAIALMNKQVMKLNRLSKNIAAYTQYLSKSHFVNYKKISLNDFINSIVDTVRQLIADIPVNFVIKLPDEEITAMIDEEKLRRAFLNVITNSIASRTGRLNISITVYPVVSGIVNIVIRDNGHGFTPLIASDKYDPVSLASAYNSLGFAVSQIFLELHGGHFSVISEQDKGTVVSMSFPVNMDKQPPAFSSMIPPYSGSMNQYLMELSPVLPPEMYKKI